jgi:hypothetical protein
MLPTSDTNGDSRGAQEILIFAKKYDIPQKETVNSGKGEML